MSVYKDNKTGTWFYTFRQNGKQIKKRGFRTKRDALNAEAKARNEKPAPESITLNELYELWMEKGRDLKPATLSHRENVYQKNIKDAFGKTAVIKIAPAALEAWQTNQAKLNKIGTVREYRAVFVGILNFGKRAGYIVSNPWDGIPMLKAPKTLDEPENFWEVSEWDAFSAAVPHNSYYDAYKLMWLTGMRRGEACALQWKNVDLDNRIIKVVANFSDSTMASPKTRASIRKIYIQDALYEFLSELHQRKSEMEGFNPDYFVIRDVRSYHPHTLTHNFLKMTEVSGCKPITLHGLRHSHASLLIDAGLDDVLIASRLGHSVQMLHQVYAHIYKHKETSFNACLNQIF
jgi:integrase